MNMSDDDSDETEGRRLYRARADALARSQVAMGKRRFKIADDQDVASDNDSARQEDAPGYAKSF
jgi:hypothetical protein